jgi:heterodisulfide reductase subunit C2
MKTNHKNKSDIQSKILEMTGEAIPGCYQCGKCSAGCPLATEMDYPPSQLMRMIQVRLPAFDKKVLCSYTIWLCLSCETCIARCPQEVDIPMIMDYLRSESMRLNLVHPKAKDTVAFHKSFLDSIRYTGRLYEIGLMADYKARSKHLFQDMLIFPRLFLAGKLSIFPHTIKNRKGFSRIVTTLFAGKKAEVKS